MKSIIFKLIWEEKIRLGEKSIFLSKGKKYKHLEELSVKIKKGKKSEHIGYTKVIRIKEVTGKDFDSITLKNVTRYRTWLGIAHKTGYNTIQKFLEYVYGKWDPEANEEFQMVEILPLSREPYNQDSRKPLGKKEADLPSKLRM